MTFALWVSTLVFSLVLLAPDIAATVEWVFDCIIEALS